MIVKMELTRLQTIERRIMTLEISINPKSSSAGMIAYKKELEQLRKERSKILKR